MRLSVLLNRASLPFLGIALGKAIARGEPGMIVWLSLTVMLVFGSFVLAQFDR